MLSIGAPTLLQPGATILVGDTRFTCEVSNTLQPYSDGSTVLATPPPPLPGGPGAAPNFAGNTSYGVGNVNYSGQQNYQETQPAPSAFTPPRPASPVGQPSYTPPQTPYVSETHVPTFI